MKKKLSSGDAEFVFFKDLWNFFQEFYDPEDSDVYWDSVYEEHKILVEKYKDYPMCRRMLVCVVDELERKHHEKENSINKRYEKENM